MFQQKSAGHQCTLPYQSVNVGRQSNNLCPEKIPDGLSKLQGKGWLWLVESHSKSSKYALKTFLDEHQIIPSDLKDTLPPRPEHSQIVGIVKFGTSVVFKSEQTFHALRDAHFISHGHGYG